MLPTRLVSKVLRYRQLVDVPRDPLSLGRDFPEPQYQSLLLRNEESVEEKGPGKVYRFSK